MTRSLACPEVLEANSIKIIHEIGMMKGLAQANPYAPPLFLIIVLWLCSGVLNSLLHQLITTIGLSHPLSLVIVLPGYIGSFLYSFLPIAHTNRTGKVTVLTPSQHWRLALISLCDFTSYSFSMVGLTLAGSGYHQMIFSSLAVVTAIFSRFVFHRTLSWTQWFSAILLAVALLLASTATIQPTAQPQLRKGLLFDVVGVVLGAALNVLSEDTLTVRAVESSVFSFHVSMGNLALVGVYFLSFTFPHGRDLLLVPIRDAGSHYLLLAAVLVLLSLSYIVRSGAYYHLLIQPNGALLSGFLQAFQAVLVLLLTHVMFCDPDASPVHCLTPLKIGASAVICGCVVVFVWQSAPQQPGGGSASSGGKEDRSVSPGGAGGPAGPNNRGRDLEDEPQEVRIEGIAPGPASLTPRVVLADAAGLRVEV
ncbi:hypothetical protein PAPYR_8598 [Paratrimastix pyriformis]|uniref:EamA domain-containing protein n=1 Tax=Paratrimastix pyriformis TaxID=342808 RepID=A0ABQ8UCX9_9EUKA|nr:hypothetical protein PAPYR_8598 [Paratrimastix pyriformis]